MGRSPWGDDDDNVRDIFSKVDSNKKKSFRPNFDQFGFSFKNILLIILVLIGLWSLSGFFKVDEGEEGAVLRFGKYVRTAMPGLNYHLPYPFETVIVENVSNVRRVEVGYRSRGRTNDKIPVSNESIMLTGDENIIDLECNVIWFITDLHKYLFNLSNQENAIRFASESAIREIIGETPISAIISTKKEQVARRIQSSMQSTMDYYDAGIKIQLVQLLKAEPPAEVIDAYRDVQTAKADKERVINQAESFRNDILPRARGEAARITQSAEGYAREIIAKAEGEAFYFTALYKEYIKEPKINKIRMQLDTVEKILKNSNKYIVGQDILPHMQLGKNLSNLKIKGEN